jgi:hypothetical protein
MLAWLFISAGMGCNNLLTLPLMLFGPDADSEGIQPDYALFEKARQEKHKSDIKLVVLPYHARSLPIEFNGTDIKLANAFVKQLKQKFAENGEHVTIVPIHEVEKFKQENPGWKSMGPKGIGEHFKADYVLDMELSSLSLMDRQSRQQFLLGNIRVSLSLLDVDKEGEEPPFTKEFTRKFPQQGARPVDLDTSKDSFQQEFFQLVAVEMSWLLTKHTVKENRSLED